MSSLLDNINLITTQENDKFAAVRRVRSLEPSDIKPSLEIISINMDSFSQYLEKGTPGFAESISVMANNIGAMVRTSYDFVDNEEDVLSIIWPFRTQVSSIFNAMGSSNQKTKSLVETISSLPRATSTFNKSRRRLVSNLDYLISVTDSARALFGQALDEIGRLITYIEGKAFKNKQ